MTHLPFSPTAPNSMASTSAKPRIHLLARIFGVWRQRRQLGRLPDHLRRDIGLSDVAIAAETARPVWDVPATWRA